MPQDAADTNERSQPLAERLKEALDRVLALHRRIKDDGDRKAAEELRAEAGRLEEILAELGREGKGDDVKKAARVRWPADLNGEARASSDWGSDPAEARGG